MGTIMEQIANVEPRERYRQLFRRLRVEYEKRGLPLTGRFELTPHCTLDCKMCYVHRADGNYPHRVLTGDEWINIMDQAIDMGMLHATLTGGECMLHPDFKKIYSYLKKRGVIVSLLTNGTLIDKDAIEMFCKMPPIAVQISLYGSTPEVYERVTGNPDAFYQVCKALRMLDDSEIITNITLTISKYNMDDVDDLWALAKNLTRGKIRVDCDLFEPIESAGYNAHEYALTYEEQRAVVEKIIRLNGYTIDGCDEDIFPMSSTDIPNTIPCAAGKSMFFVSYFGKMMPCNNFPLAEVDLLKSDVKTAWGIVNQAANKYRRSEECMNCEYLGVCKFCPSRYFIATQRVDDEGEHIPCDKKANTLLPRMYSRTNQNK